MSGDVPIIWILLAFNGLFLGAFIYRRVTDRPPLPGPVSYLLQAAFIAINCLILFPKEVDLLVDRLIRMI